MIIISTDTALTYIHPLFLHDALPICSTHRFQRLNRDDLIHIGGLVQRVNYRSQRSRWPHIDVQNPLSHRRAVTDNDAYLAPSSIIALRQEGDLPIVAEPDGTGGRRIRTGAEQALAVRR